MEGEGEVLSVQEKSLLLSNLRTDGCVVVERARTGPAGEGVFPLHEGLT